jgi:hypothetical protein
MITMATSTPTMIKPNFNTFPKQPDIGCFLSGYRDKTQISNIAPKGVARQG